MTVTTPAQLVLGEDGPAVVVSGDWLDVATAQPVVELVDEALDQGAERVAVDLSGCPCCDVYALGVLVRLRQQARERGAELVVTGAGARVRRVVDLVGLRELLDDVRR